MVAVGVRLIRPAHRSRRLKAIAVIALAAVIVLATGCDRPVDVSTMSFEERLASDRTSVVQAARHELFDAGPDAAIALLDHENSGVRLSATLALGWHHSLEHLDLLLQMTKDEDRYVRIAAIFGIGMCADTEEWVDKVSPLLADPDGSVGAEVRDAISRIRRRIERE